MHIIFRICVSLTAGISAGFLVRGISALLHYCRNRTRNAPRPHPPVDRESAAVRLVKALSVFLKYAAVFLLLTGLIWCVYYLILGAVQPEQVEYATGMSQLIVSVLTVVSILFAFVEFVRRR